jgi:hypothetical protein
MQARDILQHTARPTRATHFGFHTMERFSIVAITNKREKIGASALVVHRTAEPSSVLYCVFHQT